MRVFACLILLLFVQLNAQNDIPKKAAKNYNEGYLLFHSGKLAEARPFLQKAVDGYDKYIQAIALLAKCEMKMGLLDEAKENYGKLITVSPKDECKVYAQWGRIEIMRENYKLAQEHLQQCLATPNCNEKTLAGVKKTLVTAAFRDSLYNNPVAFNPQSLGATINSETYHDYLPMLTADGQQLFFTRRIGDPPYYNEDFYESRKNENGQWIEAFNIGEPINTEYGEGALSISPDGQRLFFTADNRVDGLGNFDIYYSYKRHGKWIDPLNIGWPINTAGWQSQPSLSADGKELFFAAKVANGLGSIDIWTSKLEGNKWGDPINLGANINTEGDEQCPYIHPDGKTLYFSSTGRLGMGQSDIYMVKRNANGEWGKATNLGYPINTKGNEGSLFVTADGITGYYSKLVDDQFDLFEFEMPEHLRPEAVTFVKGTIADANTKNFVSANINIYNSVDERLIYSSETKAFDGYFLTTLPIGGNYIFNVEKKGYLPYSNRFSLADLKVLESYELKIEIKPIPVAVKKEPTKIVMKNILFETASADLLPASDIELDKIVGILQQNPNLKMTIIGHTDNVGDESFNLQLSKQRAASVKAYLVAAKIDSNRLQTIGKGESEPIDSNDTEAGKANNRRTEFLVEQR